ncbi:hypothetical protein BDW02DRAFT_596730 [Decorospora gaudefroyi]|uniref:Uncharacterized protein n=1 Tax=Decorospora gaudefroyi TaxID=184978 RepID=A0A6A5KDE9_9PLEO|nr:hypothetical protein BDW02DRAFT_596730 [Decorospora gaudefroyi]
MRYKRKSFPPENYRDWEDGCRALAGLPRLHLFQVDMVIWDEKQYFEPSAGIVEDEALVFILVALKLINARKFTVELNIELLDNVKTALGPVPFEILRHNKLHDNASNASNAL